MAEDKKITVLTELAAQPDDSDVLYIVDDPAGTPLDKYIKASNLLLGPTTDIVTNATAIALNTTHRGSSGVDHGYIDQDVQVAATPTFGGATVNGITLIDGSADVVQLTVQAHSAQTANILEIEKSDGTVYAGADERGILFSDGGTAATNLFLGANSGKPTASGAFNVGLGNNALAALTSGEGNVGLGSGSNTSTTTGSYNLGIGTSTLLYNTAGTSNVAIGQAAGYYCTGSANIMIGFSCGFNHTSSNTLIIDNRQRADIATELTNCILYGVMAATPAAQTLRINARVGINTTPTAYLHLPAGLATAGYAPLKFSSGTDLTVAEAGVLEYNGACLYFTQVVDRRCVSLAADSIVASTVSTSTSETVIYTGTISAAELTAGKVLKVAAYGSFTTHDANDQVTIRIKLGTITVATLQSTAGTAETQPWHLWGAMTIRTIGAGGTVSGHAHIMMKTTETHTNTESTAINTTAANNITITAQWSDTSNSISIDQGYIEVLI